MKCTTICTALATLIASTGIVSAACNVTQSGRVNHTETDCASASDLNSLQGTVSGLQGVVSTQGGQITDLQNGKADKSDTYTKGETDTRLGAKVDNSRLDAFTPNSLAPSGSVESWAASVEATQAGHTNAISSLQSQTAAHQSELDNHEARITSGEVKNSEQDSRLHGHDSTLADHENRITSNTAKNVEQDGRLDNHEARITTGEVKNSEQDSRLDGHDTTLATHTLQIAGVQAVNDTQNTRLGSLETVTANHEMRLNAQDALLGQYGNTLNEHSKGIAISMAMPDLYLTEKENFSIAGNFGGFADETAIGVGAAVRLNKNWSMNLKGGSDTEFKQFGWSAGARVGF